MGLVIYGFVIRGLLLLYSLPRQTLRERLSVNFQDIHTYYQQLNIGQFFPHMLCKGEALTVAANKKLTVEPGYIYFCTEGSLTILMPDDGLNIGNTIEYMPIGLMERYCPLAKYEYRSSAKVKLVRISPGRLRPDIFPWRA